MYCGKILALYSTNFCAALTFLFSMTDRNKCTVANSLQCTAQKFYTMHTSLLSMTDRCNCTAVKSCPVLFQFQYSAFISAQYDWQKWQYSCKILPCTVLKISTAHSFLLSMTDRSDSTAVKSCPVLSYKSVQRIHFCSVWLTEVAVQL
jgi:hypothetical protein